jgi:long-chain acyl-CoA synthetase
MLGYMDNPAETATALQLHADGKKWLHTGDLGCMDADGFVYFKQRIKRMIVTSGYNVYPSQLEDVLNRHEKVLQSCCIGVPDDYRGQQIRAYIVPAPGAEPDDQLRHELLHYCTQHIAKFALPREIVFRTELPKTPMGKVAYRALEAEAAKEEST